MSGGLISKLETNRGVRTFLAQDLAGVSSNALRILTFINETQGSSNAKAMKLNIDSAMSFGVVYNPNRFSNSGDQYNQFTWVIQIDEAQFEIDYLGGMILLKKLAFYGDYLETPDPGILEIITRPKVRDLKAMDAALVGITDKLDQGIVMVSVLTGLPPVAVEELDADDFTRLSEEVAGFFPQAKAHGTGAPSLPKPPTG